jgi:hypothetical protein
MPWNMTKCQWGVPANFTNADAANAVNNANFAASVYVNVSAQARQTKQAFTYYEFNGYRLCVVAHVHKNTLGQWTQPGNCYIPGWDGWEMQTPPAVVAVVGALAPVGTFPGDARYPHPVP